MATSAVAQPAIRVLPRRRRLVRTSPILSILGPLQSAFSTFLFRYLMTSVGKGRHIIQQGGGAFEEDDKVIDQKNQKAREENSYHGKIVRKVQLKRKW